jgi:hypothetical protein
MAYDYSSENQRLELPNPYRVQNLFLFLCAAVLLAAGITALLWARAAWQGQSLTHVVAPFGERGFVGQQRGFCGGGGTAFALLLWARAASLFSA